MSSKGTGDSKDLFPLVFPVTPTSFGLPGHLRKLLCEVTPASGQERFVWSPRDQPSRTSPGPLLEVQEASLLAQPWQCHLYQGERLLGTAVYFTELPGSGRRPHNKSGSPTPDRSSGSHLQTSSPPLPALSFPIRALTSSSCLVLTVFCQ